MKGNFSSPTWKFLITAALLLGSFGGSVYVSRKSEPPSLIAQADGVVASGTKDSNELKQAFDLVNQATVKEPANPKAMMIKALITQRRGYIDDAIRTYEAMIPFTADLLGAACLNLGELYEIKGDNARAKAYYWQSVEFNPSSIGAWEKLVPLVLNAGEIDEARSDIESALEDLDDSPRLDKLKELLKQQAVKSEQ